MEENPMAGVLFDEDEIIEYDADGNAIIPDRKVFNLTSPQRVRLYELFIFRIENDRPAASHRP